MDLDFSNSGLKRDIKKKEKVRESQKSQKNIASDLQEISKLDNIKRREQQIKFR